MFIVDTSVVALRGTVSIADTAAYNGNAGRPCAIIGAKVCAVDHYNQMMLACDKTNDLGWIHFSLPEAAITINTI